MSEKQAKIERGKVLKVTIIIDGTDGRVEVEGFPSNAMRAMDVMQAGVKRVMGHFI